MENGFVSILRYLTDCVLGVIYPSKVDCLICNTALVDDNWLCKSCISKIRFCPESFILSLNDKSFEYYSLAYYSNIVTELILRLKYKSDFDCSYALADMMSEFIEKKGDTIDLVTFVPATKTAIRKRGYNQSQLLAKRIGKNLKINVKGCLNKTQETKDQIGLNAEMRWQNILGSYSLKNNCNIKQKKILLIDDVITTGSTTYCCAEELIKGGADSITILTAAKSKL